jgi:hypothetical protein
LDLLGRLPGFDFVVTPDVLAEIVLPDQKQQVENAVAAGILRVEGLSSPDALALFAELRRLMGAGEAASLALAVSKGWALASDEKKALRREALARLGPRRILTTPGLYELRLKTTHRRRVTFLPLQWRRATMSAMQPESYDNTKRRPALRPTRGDHFAGNASTDFRIDRDHVLKDVPRLRQDIIRVVPQPRREFRTNCPTLER